MKTEAPLKETVRKMKTVDPLSVGINKNKLKLIAFQ